MSFFERSCNLRGEKSLRAYSRPINLKRFASMAWVTTEEDPWAIPEYLCTIAHARIQPADREKGLTRMDKRMFGAGCHGSI